MKGMRFSLQIIITALILYYLNNTSTRAISQFLLSVFNVKVYHITISNNLIESFNKTFKPWYKAKKGFN